MFQATAPSHTKRHWSVFCATVGPVSIFKLTPRFRAWCHCRNSSTYWTRRSTLPDNAHLAVHPLQNRRPTELIFCPRTGPVLLNIGNCASRHRDNEAFKLVKKQNIMQLISILVSALFLTFREPCIVIYSYNKSQCVALFLNLILVKNSTHVSDRVTVHRQES